MTVIRIGIMVVKHKMLQALISMYNLEIVIVTIHLPQDMEIVMETGVMVVRLIWAQVQVIVALVEQIVLLEHTVTMEIVSV